MKSSRYRNNSIFQKEFFPVQAGPMVPGYISSQLILSRGHVLQQEIS